MIELVRARALTMGRRGTERVTSAMDRARGTGLTFARRDTLAAATRARCWACGRGEEACEFDWRLHVPVTRPGLDVGRGARC